MPTAPDAGHAAARLECCQPRPTRRAPASWPDEPQGLRIVSTDGMHFAPYVGFLVKTMVQRAIDDHYPPDGAERLHVVVTMQAAGVGDLEQVVGSLAEVTDTELVFVDGVRVALEDLVSAEI